MTTAMFSSQAGDGSLKSTGSAHMTYFWAPLALSFVWDGKSEAIDVCLGGYGEPVVLRLPALVGTGSSSSLLDLFRQWCVDWLRDPATAPRLLKEGVATSVEALVNGLPPGT